MLRPALYLGLGPEVSLGEVLRHFSPQLLPRLNEYRLSETEVELAAVLDCREPTALGLSPRDLIRDYDFRITQAIAAAAIAVADAVAVRILQAHLVDRFQDPEPGVHIDVERRFAHDATHRVFGNVELFEKSFSHLERSRESWMCSLYRLACRGRRRADVR
jgi:hypothetical protein